MNDKTKKIIIDTIYITSIFMGAYIASCFLTKMIFIASYDKKTTLKDFNMINGILIDGEPLIALEKDDSIPICIESEKVCEQWTYNSSYSFTNENAGSHQLSGWNALRSNLNATVVDFDDNHSKIIDMCNASIYQEIKTFNKSIYTIELWMKAYNTSQHKETLVLNSESGKLFSLILEYDNSVSAIKIRLNNDGFLSPIVSERALNTWFHVRLDVNRQESIVKPYIDGIGYSIFDIDNFNSLLKIILQEGYYRVDAIGYSWDESYSIGINKNPCPTNEIKFKTIFGIKIGFNEAFKSFRIYFNSLNDTIEKMEVIAIFSLLSGNEKYILEDSIIISNEQNGQFTVIWEKNLISDNQICLLIVIQENFSFRIDIDSISISVKVNL